VKITGTPSVGTAAGSPYTVRVVVTDANGITDTKNLSLTVQVTSVRDDFNNANNVTLSNTIHVPELGVIRLARTVADALDQRNNAGLQSSAFGGNTWLAQVFTCGTAGYLSRVRLYLRVTSGGNLTVQIRNVTGNVPGTTIYATSTRYVGATNWTWINVPFISLAYLTNGTQYAIVVSGDSDAGFSWARSGAGNPYGGGRFCDSTNGGTNWTDHNNWDAHFETYISTGGYNLLGNAVTVQIEPATVSQIDHYQTLAVGANIPTGTAITVQIQYWDGTNWQPIPDSELGGLPNSTTGIDVSANNPIDMSNVDVNTRGRIRFQFNLGTVDPAVTPLLDWYELTWSPYP